MERTASTLCTRWAVPGVITGGIVLAAVTHPAPDPLRDLKMQ